MVQLLRKLPNRKEPKSLYMDRILFEMLRGFKNAVEKHNTSVVLVVDGRSGMGKTTLSNQMAIILDKNYDLHKIHYNPKTFLEGTETKVGLVNAKPGDCILFDEAMLISSRSALSQINRMIVQAMSMIRSKKIYIIFCVNSLFDLDKNLAISRADLLLHVYGQTLISRGRYGAFFKGKDKQDRLKALYLFGKKMYDYSRPKSNFIGRFTKEFVVDESKYEIQKDKGVNEFLKGVEKPITKKILGRNNLIKYVVKKKILKVKEVAEFCDLSTQEIYKIIQTVYEPTNFRDSNQYDIPYNVKGDKKT